jgi:hypothetical protein
MLTVIRAKRREQHAVDNVFVLPDNGGRTDSVCHVIFGVVSRVTVLFCREGTVVRQVMEVACLHLGLGGTDEYVLLNETVEQDLDDFVLPAAVLVLQKRDLQSVRACVVGKGICWRGWLAWTMRPCDVFARCGLGLNEMLCSTSGAFLDAELCLEQHDELRKQVSVASDVLVLMVRSSFESVVAVSPPICGWLLREGEGKRTVVVSTEGATGKELLGATVPGSKDWSLLQKGNILNLEEPVQQDEPGSHQLQMKGPHEDHQALMQAAAAAFAESNQFSLLRGEVVLHKIYNVTHWVRQVGRVLGTLLLTHFRILFAAHDRST